MTKIIKTLNLLVNVDIGVILLIEATNVVAGNRI